MRTVQAVNTQQYVWNVQPGRNVTIVENIKYTDLAVDKMMNFVNFAMLILMKQGKISLREI